MIFIYRLCFINELDEYMIVKTFNTLSLEVLYIYLFSDQFPNKRRKTNEETNNNKLSTTVNY